MDKESIQLINLYLNRLKNGDDSFLEPLHKLVGPTLRYIALKYLKNDFDTNDLLQDFWLDIHKISSKFIFNYNGFSYLCKIMTRMAINRYNKNKKVYENSIEYMKSTTINMNQDIDVETLLIVDSVNEALRNLSPEEQCIIKLAYFEDKTIRQIGKELNMPKSNVGRMLLDSKEKMKEQLEELLWDKTEG